MRNCLLDKKKRKKAAARTTNMQSRERRRKCPNASLEIGGRRRQRLGGLCPLEPCSWQRPCFCHSAGNMTSFLACFRSLDNIEEWRNSFLAAAAGRGSLKSSAQRSKEERYAETPHTCVCMRSEWECWKRGISHSKLLLFFFFFFCLPCKKRSSSVVCLSSFSTLG